METCGAIIQHVRGVTRPLTTDLVIGEVPALLRPESVSPALGALLLPASSLSLVSLSLVLAPLGQVQRRLAGEGSIMCPQSYGWLTSLLLIKFKLNKLYSTIVELLNTDIVKHCAHYRPGA